MDNLQDLQGDQGGPVLPDGESTPLGASKAMASYRLALLLSLVLLGLALLLTVEWPSYTLHLIALRSPLTIAISLVWPMIGFLTAAMGLGATIIFRQHPSMRSQPVSQITALWPLPSLIVGLAALLLQRTISGTLWALGIATTGLLLYAVFRLEHACLSNRRALSSAEATNQWAGDNSWVEWTLHVLAYLLALSYFVLIYRTRVRTLLSAPAVLAVGGLLGMRLLHGTASDWRSGTACALVIGLILGEATWALNYWPGHSFVGGLLLFLLFYASIGLARRGLQDRLTRSVLLEYGIVTLLGLGLLIRLG